MEKIQVLNPEEHMKKRSMWMGSTKIIEDKIFVYDSKLQKLKVSHIPALVTMFTEVVMNAIDQNTKYPKLVNEIDIKFINNTITVKNNGPGIEISKNQEKNMWLPSIVCSVLFSGSNFDDENRESTGGMNGCGLKGVNFNSTLFKLETQYKNQNFKQEFQHGKPQEPIITKIKANDYTIVEFTPRFEMNHEKYERIFLGKLVQYAYWLQNVKLSFNNNVILPNTILKDQYESINFKAEGHLINIKLSICPNQGEIISIINGLLVYEGQHINFIVKYICDMLDNILKKTKQSVTKAQVKKNLYIVIICNIKNPDFDSQTKKKFVIDKNTLKNLKCIQQLTNQQTFLQQLIQLIFNKVQIDKKQKVLCKDIDKYYKALKSGGKESYFCTLFLAEGDSAIATIKQGISYMSVNAKKKPTTQSKYYETEYQGIFSLSGVIVNSRKEQNEMKIESKKLQNNKTLQNLTRILGLKKGMIYTPELVKSQLNYGKIVVVVDQDSDGVGNIFGLLLSHFHINWKSLFDCNVIYRLNTPILRVFYKVKSKEQHSNFYSKEEYESSKNEFPEKHEVKYYKGLGTHYKKLVDEIFDNFQQQLLQYKLTPLCDEKFEIYYGKQPDKRKIELSTPYLYRNIYLNEKIVACKDSLDIETKNYQLENLERKLPHIIDGLTIAKRKVLWGTLSSKGESKVCQLQGEISKKTSYHHGNTSLEGTIIKMAQSYLGARNYPFLKENGQFGTRDFGGKDHASSRYINTQLKSKWTEAIFPHMDYPELELIEEDGQIVEPKFLIPVIPFALLESCETPSNGWQCKIYARNIHHVIVAVCNYLDQRINQIPIIKYELAINENTNCQFIQGFQYSLGSYIIQKPNVIIITELPYRIWTNSYIQTIKKKPLIKEITNNSDNNNVKLIIYTTCSLDEINEKFQKKPFNGIFKYFKLYKKINNNINFISPNKSVIHLDYYIDAVEPWFNIREEMYVKRKLRLEYIYEQKILILNNQIRFLETTYELIHKNGRIQKLDQVLEILDEKKFDKLNQSYIVNSNKYNLITLKMLCKNEGDYDYLLDLKYKQTTEENLIKMKKKIEKLQQKLLEIQQKTIYEMWIDDINKIQLLL